MLTVTIFVIAPPDRSLRQVDLEQTIDHPHRVDNARVVRAAQAEANQRQSVRADNIDRRPLAPAIRTIFDHRNAIRRHRIVDQIERADAHIIAIHPGGFGKAGCLRVGPALDAIVDPIGRLTQISDHVRRKAARLQKAGSGEQCDHRHAEGEWRVAAIFLPTILLGGRPIAHDEAGSRHDHFGEAVGIARFKHPFAQQKVDQQDGKGAFVQLHAAPISGSVEPHILRPAAVSLLHGREVGQNHSRRQAHSGGDQSSRRLHQIARPDQMITAEVVIALREAPGDRQAGYDAAGERQRLVRQHDGDAGPIAVANIGRGWRDQRRGLFECASPAPDVIVAGAGEAEIQA